jgi:hypothetical protein
MLIFQRIKQHIVNNNNILVPEQYGFPHGASTDTATYNLNNTLFNGLNMNEYIAGIFYDLTTAFDCVNHEV